MKGLTKEQKKTDPACMLKAAKETEKKEKTRKKKEAEVAKVAAATELVKNAT